MNIANLGTYPPKQCGIASFSKDLHENLLIHGNKVQIIAVHDSNFEYQYGKEVVFKIKQQEKQDYIKAANFINNSDVDMVIIQHEYGIFGGQDGEYILNFVNFLNKPYIVITHTLLPKPRLKQKFILHKLCSQASGVVCMTERGLRLLVNLYEIKIDKVHIIGHGVPEFKKRPAEELKQKYNLTGKEIISTFGLIGPGKGLEIGIKAMAEVIENFPSAHYLILGQTHPVLRQYEGEKYRFMLKDLVQNLHIEQNVHFVNRFLSDEELGEYLYLTDIYLSPYPNKDQAVSGTLSFALGCGRAIVSTSYAYAQEVLKNGRGLLAEKADPHLLAQLIKDILANPELKEKLQSTAYEFGKTLKWPNIGKQYTELISRILLELVDKREEKKVNYVGL